MPALAPVTTATRGEVSLTGIGTPHIVKRLKTASGFTGDLCRGSEQRRGGGEPQCCIDRLIEIALAQITGSSLEILAHSRGQFPDHRQQTKRQEQYRDQILSCQPVLRYNFSVHQPIHDPVCDHSSRNPRIGTTAQSEGRSSVGLGGSPTPPPTRAWPARQGQVQSYTRRRSIRCQSHGGPRAPSPIRRPRRKPGAADGHLGSAEETLADYLVDRCELSGDVGCRPERPSGYRKINHLRLAPALAKIGSGMGSWFRFHPRRSRTTQGGAFGAEPKGAMGRAAEEMATSS